MEEMMQCMKCGQMLPRSKLERMKTGTYGRDDAMYEMRADAAPIEIRTHEDGHVPSGVQPLQVAVLCEALARAPHPA